MLTKLTKAQIGRAGELFVQYRLLKNGIESAPLTTDAGIDLVAFSPRKCDAVTIQVKSNLRPKAAGGTGKSSLGWWLPEEAVADLYALVDLSSDRVWLFKASEIPKLAQQHSSERYQLYMYVDPEARPRKQDKKKFDYEFGKYLIENRVNKVF